MKLSARAEMVAIPAAEFWVGTPEPVLDWIASQQAYDRSWFEDESPQQRVTLAPFLIDLHPVTRENYYHPDMLGSWSIKAVLPTIAPDMDYADLDGVSEGTAASLAYLAAIDPEAKPGEVEKIRDELLAYCRHDTLAMVRISEFFAGN